MCDGDFKESHEGRINLPEDSPDYIQNIIIYLNTGRLGPVGCPEPGYPYLQLEYQWWMARFYLLVDKYGLEEMKNPIATASCAIRFNQNTMDGWLHLAEKMYEILPADDVWYRWLVSMSVQRLEYSEPFSHRVLPNYLYLIYPDTLLVLDKWIEKSGRLATDLSLATRERLMWECEELRSKVKDLEIEVFSLTHKPRDDGKLFSDKGPGGSAVVAVGNSRLIVWE